MLDQRLAQAIRTILASEDSRFTVNNSRKRLVSDYGIGTIKGKTISFTDKERSEMRSLLAAKGYAVEQADLSGMARHERLAFTPNEKAGGKTIKRNRISIKAISGMPLLLAGQEMRLPDRVHVDCDWTEIADKIAHTCVLVVENYENFNLIHKTRFSFPERFASPLVVYRGDIHESRTDYVLSFLRHINLPTLAFVDADPAGVNIASQLPNLAGMVTPAAPVLESQLKDGSARKDLFYNQYPGYGPSLESMPGNSVCRPLWDMLSKHKACVVQERWIDESITCSILIADNSAQSREG